MKRVTKNLLSVLGGISLVFGVGISIPSWLNTNYFGFGTSVILIVVGAILLSIAYGN